MKKRCAITGHTKGLAIKLWEYFESQGYKCIGFTRREGYDISIPEQRKEIVRLAEGVDVFINNAHNKDDSQLKLAIDMLYKCKKMIVCGSIGSTYPEIFGNDPYINGKYKLSEAMHCLQTINSLDIARILYLDINYLEESDVNPDNPKDFRCDYSMKHEDVVNAVNFWMDNPLVTRVQWNTKWTEKIEQGLTCAYPESAPQGFTNIKEKIDYYLNYNNNDNEN